MEILINRIEFEYIDCSTLDTIEFTRRNEFKVYYTIMFKNSNLLDGSMMTFTTDLDVIMEEIKDQLKGI